MPAVNKYLPVLIIGAAVLIMLALASMRTQPPQKPAQARIPAVEVVLAQQAASGLVVRAQGSAQPRTQTALVSEVAGTVLEVSPQFVVGGLLRRGELLLRVDPKDYEVAVARAQAALANRLALLAQEQARSEQAVKDWASLNRPGQPNALVLRTPYLDEAKANVASAQADLAAARINLQRTNVRAPYDGLLREKRADVGQYLNVGAAIGSFAATDRAEIRLPLSDADLAVVELPLTAPVPIRIGVRGQEHQWDGLLVRTEGSLDERTRVMHVVAEITDPYALQESSNVPPLQFGTFVEAQLPARLPRAAVAVPRLALRGTDQLLVADSGNRLRLRTVQVLRADQNLVYLSSGVEVGERVITTVVETPVEGMGLEVLERAEAITP